MANKCSVSMKVSGPSEALKTFIYATLKHRTNGQKQSQKLCFTLEALVPCDVDEDPYECWGCYGDVLGDVTLQDMKWTEGCESVVFEFQTLNAPPLHWLYKVAAMYPRLTIDMGAVEYLLGINMSAHAENGKVTEDWADSPEWEDVEAPDEEEGLVCEIRSVPDEEFLYELDEMDAMGLWISKQKRKCLLKKIPLMQRIWISSSKKSVIHRIARRWIGTVSRISRQVFLCSGAVLPASLLAIELHRVFLPFR